MTGCKPALSRWFVDRVSTRAATAVLTGAAMCLLAGCSGSAKPQTAPGATAAGSSGQNPPAATATATGGPELVLSFTASVPARGASAAAPTPTPTPPAASSAPAQPTEPAGDAVKRQLTEVANGQWGREWDELHPAQQAVVSRAKWDECASKAGVPQIENITVKETYQDAIDLTSVPEKTGAAVTVSYQADLGNRKVPQTETVHEVNVSGQWRWVLNDSAITAYAAGQCPS